MHGENETDALVQLGGATLTAGAVYTTALLHRQNRAQQAFLIRQQAAVLDNIVDPPPPGPPPVDRVVRKGIGEQFKDGWNKEFAGFVRKAQGMDWGAVREQVDGIVGASMRSLRNLGQQIEK